MKNFKKIVAAFAAATMIVSVGSVAFADAVPNPTVNEDHNAVSLTNYTDIVDSSYQWTVIIIPAAKKTATSLEASDLLYINQGKSTDGFWTNMGTKGESLADGTYTIRIGGNSPTLDGMSPRYYEADFTVETTPEGPSYILGDAYVDGAIDLADVSAVLGHILGTQIISDETALLGADAYPDKAIDLADVSAILGHILGTQLLSQN